MLGPTNVAPLMTCHRDVKAANVLVTHGWGAKVTGFGLSRTMDAMGGNAMTQVSDAPCSLVEPNVVLCAAHDPLD